MIYVQNGDISKPQEKEEDFLLIKKYRYKYTFW